MGCLMKRKNIILILKILTSILILSILLYKLDYNAVIYNLKTLPLIIILLMVVEYCIAVFMNSLAFFVLFKERNKKIKFLDFLKLNWYAFSIGQFSPGRVGEMGITYLLKKRYNFAIGKSFASFLVYRISAVVVLLLFGLIAIPLYFDNLNSWIPIIILFLVFIICFILAIHNDKLRFFIRKYILRKYAPLISGFYIEIKQIIRKKSLVIKSTLISALKFSYGALTVTIILYILGIKVPFLLVLGINSISMLFTFIPISFSGIGIKESAAVFLFYYLGYNAATIGAVYIMFTATYLILNFSIFLYFTYIKETTSIENKKIRLKQ